ncbi:YceI family protein [Maribacter polysaccharolyticus]|uniref:YceI family protein n=1 Tax=Maribacter polysaccharolyticus TaxID=3020831 RepID=UPI00237FB295|nr:YceI family protein [Maribacter polysaccharolyticus]MDE3743907.1 YceI family protein [Maribacter polysaccharolyticus]
MKITFKPFNKSILLLFSLLLTQTIFSQEFKLSKTGSSMTVLGTSSIHDWEIVAEEQSGTIQLGNDGDNITIKALKLTIPAESLKSGKGMMDNNTYKALKTDKYKNIVFEMTKVKEIVPNGNNTYKVACSGDLTLCGVTKNLSENFLMTVTNDKVTLTGENSFKMTEFGITPPKALMGTIKTGDEVTIKYASVLTK